MSNILLNIKTDYELLSSLIKVKDLISYAKNNNINTLGVTDSNLFSFMEFYELCKKSNIKPIVGIDITIDNKKIILYAKNFKGYQNLCKIVSEKNTNDLNIEVLKNADIKNAEPNDFTRFPQMKYYLFNGQKAFQAGACR